jgi:hypothetical protein
MTPMTANSADDPARSRDLARLRELTRPHPPHPAVPIQQALPRMTAVDFAETIAVLERLGKPEESVPA